MGRGKARSSLRAFPKPIILRPVTMMGLANKSAFENAFLLALPILRGAAFCAMIFIPDPL
jgi:hypothetical protein